VTSVNMGQPPTFVATRGRSCAERPTGSTASSLCLFQCEPWACPGVGAVVGVLHTFRSECLLEREDTAQPICLREQPTPVDARHHTIRHEVVQWLCVSASNVRGGVKSALRLSGCETPAGQRMRRRGACEPRRVAGGRLRPAGLGIRGEDGAVYASRSQDLERGKRTETDALNGFGVRRGAERSVPAPVNQTLLALVKLRERRFEGAAGDHPRE
jgi:hypothetical protein